MEINVRVIIDASERLIGAFGGLLRSAAPVESEKPQRIQMTADAPAAQPEPEAAQVPAPVAAAPGATVEPVETAAAQVETVTVPEAPATAQAEPEMRKEQPEDVLPLLRQQFGIPESKEERDEEQQRRARNLGKAVLALIKDITKNPRARSVADLRTDADRTEFIRCALLITMDSATGQFQVNAF